MSHGNPLSPPPFARLLFCSFSPGSECIVVWFTKVAGAGAGVGSQQGTQCHEFSPFLFFFVGNRSDGGEAKGGLVCRQCEVPYHTQGSLLHRIIPSLFLSHSKTAPSITRNNRAITPVEEGKKKRFIKLWNPRRGQRQALPLHVGYLDDPLTCVPFPQPLCGVSGRKSSHSLHCLVCSLLY